MIYLFIYLRKTLQARNRRELIKGIYKKEKKEKQYCRKHHT